MRVSPGRDIGRFVDWAGYVFLALLAVSTVYGLLYHRVQSVIVLSFFLLFSMMAVWLGRSS